MQRYNNHNVSKSKPINVRTLLRYHTLVFLLLSATMLFANEAERLPTTNRYDRCELQGFFGITHNEPGREKLASLGYEPKGGAIVTNVIGCTAALNAGIQPMDYLYEVNGKSTNGSTGFFCLMSDFEIGESFKVGLLRKGKAKTVTVTLGRRSDACQRESPFPKRGFFGILDTESDRKPGVLIDVSSRGPVSQLGLQDGDRLLRINGYAIADWTDLSIVKRLISDADNVSFEVIRDGNDLTVSGAIPEEQHYVSNWNNERNERGILADCVDEIEDAIDDIDFDEIEREIEYAIRSSDVREETEDAVEEVLITVREVFGGLKSRQGNWNADHERTPDIDPSEMDARVEAMDEDDLSKVENFEADMPKNRNLVINEFSATPNPNQGRFRLTFQLPKKGDTRIAIYSAAGREVYAYDLGEYTGLFTDELDIMRNGPGSYFLVVRQDDKAFVRKLVLIER